MPEPQSVGRVTDRLPRFFFCISAKHFYVTREMGDALKNDNETMTKKFYPNDGRPGIPFSSEKDIEDYMGDVMKDFGPIEIEGDLVLTQLHGHYIAIGKMK